MPKITQKSKVKSQNYIANLKTSVRTINRRTVLILLVLGLLILLLYKRGLIIVAMVNGQPITSLELQAKLNRQFKDQILSQIINEKILEQEAVKKGMAVTSVELNQKIKAIESQYGGVDAFNTLLSQQGMTREDFLVQTKLQLLVEKLYSSEASPSSEEIDQFMQANKDTPEATEPAKFLEIAQKQTRQSKLAKIFSEKFQSLKATAKIQIF